MNSVERKPENYIAVADVAHAVGVKPEAAAMWFRTNRHRVFKDGSRNYVLLGTADLYYQLWGYERVGQRPKGWRTFKWVQLECGVGRSTIEKAIAAGRIKAVVYGKVVYLEPEGVSRFILEYVSLKPLPGWVLVPTLRDELGRTKEALNQWIRREKIEVRHFLHPTCNRPTAYVHERDAERYRQIVTERGDRHVGLTWKTGELTTKVIEQFVGSAGANGVCPDEIAAATGFSHETSSKVAAKLARSGRLERHGRGTSHHPFRYRLAALLEAA